MRIRFWGTRGSVPAPMPVSALAEKFARALAALGDGPRDAAAVAALPFHLRGTYGGNTSCVEVEAGGETVLFDAGSGLREFGRSLAGAPPRTYHLMLSHTHWDHIMGLPFFGPLYQPGSRIVFYGGHPNLERRIIDQHEPEHFPVRYRDLPASLSYVRLKPGRPIAIGPLMVTSFLQRHPGGSFGYRLDHDGRTVVYSTDSEHKNADDSRADKFVSFCRGADLLIFDAQYAFVEACTDKAGWGHSSNVFGVELAKRAAVHRLSLFHHDPAADDESLDARLAETRYYAERYRPEVPLEVSMAYDGLEMSL